jgi:hypothetical protein
MKVTDIRRKLIAALAAGGLIAPGMSYAAELDTNLVVNGDFESVDINTISGGYNAVKILDWNDGTKVGFAYSHDGSLNGLGYEVPDYANGGPLASGGHFYFTPIPSPGWAHVQGQVTQLIDVSEGLSGSLISSGLANFDFQADFSSYLNQGDFGNVYAQFLNEFDAEIGAVLLDNQGNTATWIHDTAVGTIPAATRTIRMSVFGTRIDFPENGGPDGYIDNVDFRITATPPELMIVVDRLSGNITLSNLTGSLENISAYSITSEFESLKPASWLSIAENYDSGNPGPNQVDSAHAWSELTNANAHGDLSETDFATGVGANLADQRTVNLGNAWIQTPTEDLVFQYISNGQVIDGIVAYTGNNNEPLPVGDLNASGTVTSADWAIFRSSQRGDFSGLSLAEAYRIGDLNRDLQNDHADFILFKEAYDGLNGSGSFDAMLAGGPSVPEPSSVVLVLGCGICAGAFFGRSNTRR